MTCLSTAFRFVLLMVLLNNAFYSNAISFCTYSPCIYLDFYYACNVLRLLKNQEKCLIYYYGCGLFAVYKIMVIECHSLLFTVIFQYSYSIGSKKGKLLF